MRHAERRKGRGADAYCRGREKAERNPVRNTIGGVMDSPAKNEPEEAADFWADWLSAKHYLPSNENQHERSKTYEPISANHPSPQERRIRPERQVG